MKVLNLRCAHDHGFEGWFASETDFVDQNARGVVECPMCGNQQVTRLPSAPRLNLSGARAPTTQDAVAPSAPVPAAAVEPSPAQMQAMWLRAVQQVLKTTEDVGERFPEEARRIHYGETEHRGIRGQASVEERAALADEGIEVMPLPLPAALKGGAH
ncbi:MAG: hypothetical protein A3E25_20440 [Burkholderiales bacterium RIFCSPHIGHO2_12_FULL_69_20]|jgi:hypothetical protein|nr:MAG: hypothetical protein A3E25_20440 [Burkholderiales bacterium RIFCSPHIGHO2_12_FULL_69_20]